ncbi:MAG TPA: hypothetical protein VEU08_13700, partial [Vicinamibacterales bacterium]|nr:hypothetical protein [Vicinamibacterales bacterium]
MITIAIACLGAAIAAWLIPASVDIVSWTRSGPARVAVFAPQYALWWAVAAAIVAAIGIAFVRRPDAGARAERAWVVAPIAALWLWTLPYLPWLADRVPLLLVLAGPLRWAIAIPAIAACAFRVIDGARSARLKPRPPVPAPRPPAPEREPLGERPEAAGERLAWDRRIVFVVSLVAYLLLGHQSLATVGLGGDEPHYLVITHSLLVDHDLKIGNNHARGDYRAFFGGDLRPDYMQRGKDGEIYSIHAPGLSALLLPGYAAAGASGAVVIICLFAALAAVAVFELAARAGGRLAAWATSASICFTVPFIPHAWSIYPEIAGAAIVAWGAVWLDSADDVTGLSWFGRGLVVAGLPWLHTKFVVILA